MAQLPSPLAAGAGPPSASLPQAGAGTQPGQPPFGSSPLSMPVPNRGNQAAGLAAVQNAVKLLEDALPHLAAEPEMGPALMKAVESLRKLVPEGAIPQGVADSKMQQFMLQQRQQNPVLAAIKAAMAGGAGGGAGGGAPPGVGGPMMPGAGGGGPPGAPPDGAAMPSPPGGQLPA